MIVLRRKTLLSHFFYFNLICHNCLQGLREGFRKLLCICINMKRRADQPFLALIILRPTLKKGKREEFTKSEQKGNIAKPRLPIGGRESLGRCLDSTNQFCAAYSPAVQKLYKENFEKIFINILHNTCLHIYTDLHKKVR